MRLLNLLALPVLLAASSARGQQAPAPPAAPAVPTPPAAPARLAIVDFQLAGTETSPALALQLQDGFSVGLTRAGLRVLDLVDVGRRLERSPELQRCETSTCLKRLGQVLEVPHVVRLRVEAAGNTYKMTARVFSTEGSTPGVLPIDTQARYCDVCTVDEAREHMIRLGEAIRRPFEEPPVAIAAPPPPPPRPRPSRVGPALGLVSGVAAIVAGAAVLAATEDRGRGSAAFAGGLMGVGMATTSISLYYFFDSRRTPLDRTPAAAGGGVTVRY